MITFIPSWHEKTINNVSSDDLIGQVKSFMHSDDAYQVLVSNYMPFCRYFLHRYEILESNYWNLFDELQGITEVQQRAVTLDDFDFDDDIRLIYTPFVILARSDDQTIAEIRTEQSGQVQSALYFKDGLPIYHDHYDDRGFISSREIFQDEKLLYTSYFNLDGDWVLHEFADSHVVKVNSATNQYLSQLEYSNMHEIEFEMLNKKLSELDDNDSIVMSITDDNFMYMKNVKFKKQLTASFFADRFTFSKDKKKMLKEFVTDIKSSLVDSDSNYEQLNKIVGDLNTIHKISPYDTRFEFGKSQEMKEEVIFFDARNLSDSDLHDAILEILKYIFKNMKKTGDEKEDRKIGLTLRGNLDDEDKLKGIVNEIINQLYPDTLDLIKQFMELKASENPVDQLYLLKFNSNVKFLAEVIEGIAYEIINTDDELMKSLNRARIIVDLSHQPDQFTQIAAISTGIPQINMVKTEFVEENKNGIVIKDIASLKKALNRYLNQLKYWQDARAYSAQKISQYSGDALKNYLLEITGEQ
ncbi:accessory Sec system protein Asp1 [Companilactobacillus sp. RD055328]|uniref:accessory Sec system protein Asp1 n=1 Tax=Companilactobacillus sp. RD055328 TaxID=2916634 RepID=UPI001FC8D7F3|nr:accessory Sec system protein Asp1 [Companilactobacillus sp. RD055328]GKQ42752.1 accessory Sec system protein Asp1 [Companilactobacillus sp. RD055328]